MSEIGGKAKAVLFNYADWKLPPGKTSFFATAKFDDELECFWK